MNNQKIYPQEVSESYLAKFCIDFILWYMVHNTLPQMCACNHGSELMTLSTQGNCHYILLTLNVMQIRLILT